MNKAQITAIAVIAAGALWVGSGFIGREESPPPGSGVATPAAQVETAPTVRVVRAQAEPYVGGVVLQGRTAASRSVELRTEVSGKLEKVLVDRGQPVKEGQDLFQIAINDRKVKLDQARAFLEQRQIQVQASRELAKQSFQSQVRLAEAEAQFVQAQADVERFELELKNTRIKAPFDGVLDTRLVDEGAYLNSGDTLGTVVDLDPITVTAQISERNVSDARVGMPAKVVLTDGRTIEGTVSYIASVSDPNTRTFTIEAMAPNAEGAVLSGLAAQMRLPFGQNIAHLISPSVMTLSDEGRLGVKAVDDENKVKFWPVDIIDDGPEGTWVSGLPETFTLIIVGQEYVAIGQKVTPVPAEADKTS